jgi:hypothetical protein
MHNTCAKDGYLEKVLTPTFVNTDGHWGREALLQDWAVTELWDPESGKSMLCLCGNLA